MGLIPLAKGDNLDRAWEDILRRAVSDWNESGTVTLRLVKGQSNPQDCPPTTGQVEVCHGLYGTQERWLGLARLVFAADGEHIESATVQLNDSFFDRNGGKYNSEAARRHTMCHELGHTAGLGHVATSSCLNDSQQAIVANVEPRNQDFRDLARIYAHKDATTTVAASRRSRSRIAIRTTGLSASRMTPDQRSSRPSRMGARW